MVARSPNTAASVHQKLLNLARSTSRPFQEVLQHFAIERFIYRLSRSPHAERFVLKGALMFRAWSGLTSRPTMDIDLLGRIDNSLDVIVAVLRNACEVATEPDGMVFHAETVSATRVMEDADYHGVRVRLQAHLGNARVPLQIDIGFGDVVVPEAEKVTYPVLLDHPAPVLQGYSMETTIAEKFQAMVRLGILNSRMKDFYDIWMLSHAYDFEGVLLAEAVEKTFAARNTQLGPHFTVFEPAFIEDAQKQVQWQSFLKKATLPDAPESFAHVVAVIRSFLQPVVTSQIEGHAFRRNWRAPGPWR